MFRLLLETLTINPRIREHSFLVLAPNTFHYIGRFFFLNLIFVLLCVIFSPLVRPVSAHQPSGTFRPPFVNLNDCLSRANSESLGVKYFCQHIINSWQRIEESAISQENGLIIDFSKVSVQNKPRGLVESAALARLFAVPDLIPPTLFGGLLLRNVELADALVLTNITVRVPITFNNALFNFGPVNLETFAQKSQSAGQTRAFIAESAVFEKQLRIINSTINGMFQITKSTFFSGLNMSRNTFNRGGGDTFSQLYISGTKIDSGLILRICYFSELVRNQN